MIALTFISVEMDADMQVKQSTATKQMHELVSQLQTAPKYHTLTKRDREQLKKQYAPDLVDNLVVITKRDGELTSSEGDSVMAGFTYAAFDPALYANAPLRRQIERQSHGCCAYCESFLLPTGGGVISHFRPVQLLDDYDASSSEPHHECSPYYSLAYQQENLVYACTGCEATHKAGRFPVVGDRFPAQAIENELALLINPYHEKPRDFIRFNPNNGEAYAYDQVCDFYLATQNLTAKEVEQRLWEDPSSIPNQFDAQHHLLTNEGVQMAFEVWHKSQSHNAHPYRGEVTIDTLGLNRRVLVVSRLAMLRQYYADFSLRKHELALPFLPEEIRTTAYRSLAIDAFSTWLNDHENPDSNSSLNHTTRQTMFAALTKDEESEGRANAPVWLRSCLAYLVTESELEHSTKRRLVCLSGNDRYYGQTDTEKCVFLPIEWQNVRHNIIKVRSHRNIWEASFAELADSRPQELINLFANNEVWVEGEFTSLV